MVSWKELPLHWLTAIFMPKVTIALCQPSWGAMMRRPVLLLLNRSERHFFVTNDYCALSSLSLMNVNAAFPCSDSNKSSSSSFSARNWVSLPKYLPTIAEVNALQCAQKKTRGAFTLESACECPWACFATLSADPGTSSLPTAQAPSPRPACPVLPATFRSPWRTWLKTIDPNQSKSIQANPNQSKSTLPISLLSVVHERNLIFNCFSLAGSAIL